MLHFHPNIPLSLMQCRPERFFQNIVLHCLLPLGWFPWLHCFLSNSVLWWAFLNPQFLASHFQFFFLWLAHLHLIFKQQNPLTLNFSFDLNGSQISSYFSCLSLSQLRLHHVFLTSSCECLSVSLSSTQWKRHSVLHQKDVTAEIAGHSRYTSLSCLLLCTWKQGMD